MPSASPTLTALRKRFLVASGVLGALAVLAGAFGAHALANAIEPRMLEVWATANRYHMWHALALLALACASQLWSTRAAALACASWVAGIVLFCGSLYLLAVTGVGALGAVAPLGGLALIAGWVALVLAALRAGG